jgi:hypothetical protein
MDRSGLIGWPVEKGIGRRPPAAISVHMEREILGSMYILFARVGGVKRCIG